MSVDKYVTVQQDCRAWADMGRVHKMGWLRTGDVIYVVGEYKNWYRFEPYTGCSDLLPATDIYPNYHVHKDDLVTAEPPPPPPEEVDDAELGKALRILVNLLASALKDSLQE